MADSTGFTFGVEVDLEMSFIVPNHNQPRDYFNDEELEELAAGMRDYKQVTAIEVFPLERQEGQPQMFMILSGERRWRATKLNGKPTIRAIIVKRPENPDQLFLDSYLANSAVPHTTIEHFRAQKWMHVQQGLTVEQIAQRTGRKKKWVEDILSLDRLHPAVLELMDPKKTKDTLPYGQALKLIGVDQELQLQYAKIITGRGLNVQQTATLLHDAPKSHAAPKVLLMKSQEADDARKLIMFQTLVKAIQKGAQEWDGENMASLKRVFPNQPPSIRSEAVKSLQASIAALETLMGKIALSSTERAGGQK